MTEKKNSPIRFLMGYLELHGRHEWIKDVCKLWWRGFQDQKDHVDLSRDDVKQLLSLARRSRLETVCDLSGYIGFRKELFVGEGAKAVVGEIEMVFDSGQWMRVDSMNIGVVLGIIVADFKNVSPLAFFELMKIAEA